MLNHQEYNISRILIKELSERFSTFWQTFVLCFRYTKRGVFSLLCARAKDNKFKCIQGRKVFLIFYANCVSKT